MNHCIISEHYKMIETDKMSDDNERTTRARAVYVKMWVVKGRRDVIVVCISGQGRLCGLHEPVHRRGAAIAGKCKACERSDWKRSRYRG